MREPTRFPRSLLAAAVAVVVLATSSAAVAADDPAVRRQQVRQKQAELASRLNVLKADQAELDRALAALERDVEAQRNMVTLARQQADLAARRLDDARRAEQAKAAELATLNDAMKRAAVAAYMGGDMADLLSLMGSSSIDEATRKRELIELRMNRSDELADRLRAARDDLEQMRKAAEVAQAQATTRRQQVESRLSALEQSARRQRQFTAEIENKIDITREGLSQAAAVDRELSARIAQQERASRSSGVVRVRSGNVPLSNVRGIVVNSAIADRLEAMLAAAEADGIVYGGSGYRDPSGQVAVRRSNCGTSQYDVYEKPASQCRPPTARPGQSMHEQGLAIDFTYQGSVISSRSSPGYRWLAANASRYGFYNLPSEPWHWSTNGN